MITIVIITIHGQTQKNLNVDKFMGCDIFHHHNKISLSERLFIYLL